MSEICVCLRPLGKFNTSKGWYCADCGREIRRPGTGLDEPQA